MFCGHDNLFKHANAQRSERPDRQRLAIIEIILYIYFDVLYGLCIEIESRFGGGWWTRLVQHVQLQHNKKE